MPERVKTLGDFFGQFGGWLVGFLAVLGTIFYNSRKVQIDESALVLAKWKEFAEIHQADMKRLRDEMDKDRTRYEAELEHVRRELKEVQTEFAQFRKQSADEILGRDNEIAGLKRAIAQNSQSTAFQLGHHGVTRETGNRQIGDILREINEDDGA